MSDEQIGHKAHFFKSNLEPPRTPDDEVRREVARIDAAIAALSSGPPSGDIDWQPIRQPARRVVLRSLKKYRQRLVRR